MIKIKSFLTIIVSLLFISNSYAQNKSKISVKDFQMLSGSWQGALTYLDYSSGKPYTMPADLDIKRIGKSNKFIFSNIYPNEKNANGIDTISISDDGKYIDKELVKSRNKLLNGDIEIVTEEQGKDGNDNRQATIRHSYTFGKENLSNRKDVQFLGETQWIKRHEYTYKRKLASNN